MPAAVSPPPGPQGIAGGRPTEGLDLCGQSVVVVHCLVGNMVSMNAGHRQSTSSPQQPTSNAPPVHLQLKNENF